MEVPAYACQVHCHIFAVLSVWFLRLGFLVAGTWFLLPFALHTWFVLLFSHCPVTFFFVFLFDSVVCHVVGVLVSCG